MALANSCAGATSSETQPSLSSAWAVPYQCGHTRGQVEKVILTEVTDLSKPIDVSIGFSGKGTVRQEGKEQRWRIPIRALASNVLTVKDRKYPLLTGPISKFNWRIRMALPAGARVRHTPETVSYKHKCLIYRRGFTKAKGTDCRAIGNEPLRASNG